MTRMDNKPYKPGTKAESNAGSSSSSSSSASSSPSERTRLASKPQTLELQPFAAVRPNPQPAEPSKTTAKIVPSPTLSYFSESGDKASDDNHSLQQVPQQYSPGDDCSSARHVKDFPFLLNDKDEERDEATVAETASFHSSLNSSLSEFTLSLPEQQPYLALSRAILPPPMLPPQLIADEEGEEEDMETLSPPLLPNLQRSTRKSPPEEERPVKAVFPLRHVVVVPPPSTEKPPEKDECNDGPPMSIQDRMKRFNKGPALYIPKASFPKSTTTAAVTKATSPRWSRGNDSLPSTATTEPNTEPNVPGEEKLPETIDDPMIEEPDEATNECKPDELLPDIVAIVEKGDEDEVKDDPIPIELDTTAPIDTPQAPSSSSGTSPSFQPSPVEAPPSSSADKPSSAAPVRTRPSRWTGDEIVHVRRTESFKPNQQKPSPIVSNKTNDESPLKKPKPEPGSTPSSTMTPAARWRTISKRVVRQSATFRPGEVPQTKQTSQSRHCTTSFRDTQELVVQTTRIQDN